MLKQTLYAKKIHIQNLQDTLVFDWLTNHLSSKAHSLKMKNRLLELLAPYVQNFEEKIASILKRISDKNFPLTSKELTFGSSVYSDYVVTFERLCEIFEETASKEVLVNTF